VPWLTITAGATGNGNATIRYSAAANTGPSRTGTITAGGQTFTVTQAAACNGVVSPDTIGAPAAECSWTAASNAPWIVIAPGTGGTGSASVSLAVQANTGPARSGTATVAGRTVTVNQDAGCSFSVSPSSQAVPIEGGSGSATVTTTAGCTWTATSNNPDWLTITSGASGSETGPVQFTVSANATGAARAGTLTIAGQTFTVNQAGPESIDNANESPRAVQR
jgi:hypothetical protein